ncbi:hypothetical protein [Neisseria bergeri]|uniref:hypothetical protein n=1 Tax=Neisseria bergeri TaxID=1906581 RepID=UPI0027DF8829|nr:hypothetical protein [Neisseria bergeri]
MPSEKPFSWSGFVFRRLFIFYRLKGEQKNVRLPSFPRRRESIGEFRLPYLFSVFLLPCGGFPPARE